MIFVKISPDLEMPLQPELLERAAVETLDQQSITESDLSLVLTNDTELRSLNREYLGKDSPTDVLSFPADELDPETGRRYLGDVIISLTRAMEQAASCGHPVLAEVQLLVIHGVLHLLGHDHAGHEEKRRMWQAQAVVLSRIGLSTSLVHE